MYIHKHTSWLPQKESQIYSSNLNSNESRGHLFIIQCNYIKHITFLNEHCWSLKLGITNCQLATKPAKMRAKKVVHFIRYQLVVDGWLRGTQAIYMLDINPIDSRHKKANEQ